MSTSTNIHPILGDETPAKTVILTVDGRPVTAREGDMIAAALLRAGIRINRYTTKNHEPRGVFCGIGQCTDCVMVVNGRRNVRTCVTRVEAGMAVETQNRGGENSI
jgi:predicted molibdopterin-dependent oxidoreductase YjgC